MTKREQLTVFRCNHGEIFETAQAAAQCNLQSAVLAASTGVDKTFPCVAWEKNNPTATLAETAIVSHWVAKNADLLEHLIRTYMDDCAAGQPPIVAPSADEEVKKS